MQRTDENQDKSGFRRTKGVWHFPTANLSYFYFGMVGFFFSGVLLFVFFVGTLPLGGNPHGKTSIDGLVCF
jgi:hypothetical protein